MHCIMLCPQNGDRIMIIDSVTSLHAMYKKIIKRRYIVQARPVYTGSSNSNMMLTASGRTLV